MISIKRSTHDSSQFLEKSKKSFEALIARQDIGFFKLTRRDELWEQSLSRAQQIKSNFDHMIVCGIGGSSLGGLALLQALNKKNVEFFENVDALDFWERIQSIKNLDRVHWVFISKSGKTVETLNQANFISQYLKQKGITLAANSTVVSERKTNPLTTWAQENGVFQLEIPLDVGGRFSVLSPVGLLPAAFADVSLDDLKEGADWALKQKDLISELASQTLASFKREEWITLFWMYCNRLRYSGLWVQQLWAESLAKKDDRRKKTAPRASTPIPLVGANDQHSVLQQVAEGYKDKFVFFVRVKQVEEFGPVLTDSIFSSEKYLIGKKMGSLLAAEAEATALALEKNDVASCTLVLEDLSAKSMGAFFMLFELWVGLLGEAMDIDAFDQPGVELGKRLARDMLMSPL